MKNIILILMLTTHLLGYTTSSEYEIWLTEQSKDYDNSYKVLETIENISKQKKKKLIAEIMSSGNVLSYLNDPELKEEYEIEKQKFYFIDLDKDGDRDFIYIGFCGSETDCIEIYINKNNNYKKNFSAFTWQAKLKFKNTNLIEIVLRKSECCTYNNTYELFYNMSIKKDSIKSLLVKRIFYLDPNSMEDKLVRERVEKGK
jgi:hypothetical protein